MMLTSEAPDRWHVIVVFIAVLVTTASCYFAMINSQHVIHVLGESGRRILTKLFGLILGVVAVQFVLNGVSDAVMDYLPALRAAWES